MSVPPEMRPTVAIAIASLKREQLFNTATLGSLFGRQAANVLGPAWIGYADRSDLLAPASHDGRILDARQASLVERFIETLSQEERRSRSWSGRIDLS